MLEELATTLHAIQWYSKNRDNQYSEQEIDRYDQAARTLTQRAEFASVLVRHITDKPGDTLEIAAGTGIISEVLQKHIPDVVYTDIEPAAITRLHMRLGAAAIQKADFLNLPFKDSSFDMVIGVGAYRYVPQGRKQDFWDELHRVLRPQGRAYIAQFYPRGFAIRGSDIDSDKYFSEQLFSLADVWSYDAKVDIGPLQIKSGSYLSYQFNRN